MCSENLVSPDLLLMSSPLWHDSERCCRTTQFYESTLFSTWATREQEYFDLLNTYDPAHQLANTQIRSSLVSLVHRTLSVTLPDQQLLISLCGAGRTSGLCWFVFSCLKQLSKTCLCARVGEAGIGGEGDFSHLLPIREEWPLSWQHQLASESGLLLLLDLRYTV